MQSPAPQLLPLLRSALQGEVLALILLNPEQEWSLTELANRVGASVSTAQREVSRAEDAGVVVSRRVGNTRLVRALPSPITQRPDRDELDDAAQRAYRRLGREVNVTIRSLAWWRNRTDGFHAEVTSRPLVPIRSVPETGDAS